MLQFGAFRLVWAMEDTCDRGMKTLAVEVAEGRIPKWQGIDTRMHMHM